MRRRIRQFFWVSSFLGLISVFSAFSYAPEELLGQLGAGNDNSNSVTVYKQTVKNGQTTSMEKHEPFWKKTLRKGLTYVQKSIDKTCPDCKIKVIHRVLGEEEETKKVGLQKNEWIKSKDGNYYYMNRNGKRYIYHNGKYYQARVGDKKIFNEDGTPTLVIDNSSTRYDPEAQKAKEKPKMASARSADKYFGKRGQNKKAIQLKAVAGQNGNNKGGILNRFQKVTGAYNPQNVKQMMQDLETAKKQMNERNNKLKQILVEDDNAYKKR